MSRPNFDRLVPPPRAVPLGLRVDALFGGGGGFPMFAWGMLLFTTPVFWGLAMNAEVLAPIVLGASAATTDGRVTAMDKPCPVRARVRAAPSTGSIIPIRFRPVRY